MKQLVSISGSAEALGIGKTKLYELIAEGELATIKLGRRRLVTLDSLLEFVAARTQ